ncbi:hypothetical protein K492DRAFT_173924 [Lichtheimia hyalospora FSU 10163]|nr:hypothetical protein K492DRAFT_173924 [Lichtheimia hyalospora FSU 10163]
MTGFIDKLKQQFEIWKIEKYTKRRAFLPEYDSKDKEYYERYYRDGVYYAATDNVPPLPSETSSNKLKALQRAPSVATKRASTLLRRSTTNSRGRGTPAPRCSETYNTHFP